MTLTSIGDGVMTTDAQGRVTFLNPVAEALTGWSTQDALGQPVECIFRIINEPTGHPAPDLVEQVLREKRSAVLANNTCLLTKAGRSIPIEDSAAPIWDTHNNILGVVLVFHDVTERRRAQQALRDSEQRVRLKLDSILSPEGDIGVLELADIIDVPALQSLMEQFYEVAGIPVSITDLKGNRLVGAGWQDICTRFHRVNPESCKHCLESNLELSKGVRAGEFKLYKCKNNMWDVVTPLVVGGKHVGNIFISQFLFDDESPDREAFRAQARQFGFDESAYLAALERVPRLSHEALTSGMKYFTKLADMISKLSYSNVKLAHSLAEREALAGTLRANQARLRMALEAAKSGTWEWDLETGKNVWSDEVWALYGVEPHSFEPSHENWLRQVHPQDRAMADRITAEAARTASELSLEFRVAAGGGERWLLTRGRPVRDDNGRLLRFAGIVMDATERKQAEQVLIRTEKLASVGRMAATVAHEINNPLEAITNLVFIACTDPSLSHRAQASLRMAQQELAQVAHITRQTLGFYRENATPSPVQLAELVDGVLELYARKLKDKDIKVQRDYAGGEVSIHAVAGELRQVIANLVANGIDALGEGGRLAIRLSPLLRAAKKDGGAVRLTIADNGVGIAPEHLKRIFEPFFTTKQDVGTGLGLWVTSEIVKKHGGFIRMRSRQGKGTAFSVFLPARDAGKSFAKRASA